MRMQQANKRQRAILVAAITALVGQIVSELVYFFVYVYDEEANSFFLTGRALRPLDAVFLVLLFLPVILLLLCALLGNRPRHRAILRLCLLGSVALQNITVGLYNLITSPKTLAYVETPFKIQYVIIAVFTLAMGLIFAWGAIRLLLKPDFMQQPDHYAGMFEVYAYPGWLLDSVDVPTYFMNLGFYLEWKQYLTVLTAAAFPIARVALYTGMWLIGRAGKDAVETAEQAAAE